VLARDAQMICGTRRQTGSFVHPFRHCAFSMQEKPDRTCTSSQSD
jgi:hypothetical protein